MNKSFWVWFVWNFYRFYVFDVFFGFTLLNTKRKQTYIIRILSSRSSLFHVFTFCFCFIFFCAYRSERQKKNNQTVNSCIIIHDLEMCLKRTNTHTLVLLNSELPHAVFFFPLVISWCTSVQTLWQTTNRRKKMCGVICFMLSNKFDFYFSLIFVSLKKFPFQWFHFRF